ncbi:hypothetical protein V6N13_032065 [Hibiscus sabdariffa]
MVVDRQPGTKPKGPHRLGLLLVSRFEAGLHEWVGYNRLVHRDTRFGYQRGTMAALVQTWHPPGCRHGRLAATRCSDRAWRAVVQACWHQDHRGCFTGLGHLEPSTILGHLGFT